jgi:hypothetical protein
MAPRWPRTVLAAHLVGATSYAMLAKTTSPLFCTVPGLIALAVLVRRPQSPVAAAARPDAGRSWALALPLAAGCGIWYLRNRETALHHATTAAFGPIAEMYGHRATFAAGLSEWGRIASWLFWLKPVFWLLAAVVVLAFVRRRVERRPSVAHRLDSGAAGALAQILIAFSAFALSPSRDARFAAPALPLIGVVVAWAVLNSGHAAVGRLVVAALAVQLALVHLLVLDIWTPPPGIWQARLGVDPSMSVLHRDRRPVQEAEAIVHRTCGRLGSTTHNFVGIDLMGLNGHSLTYAAAKERLLGRGGRCEFFSPGFSPVEDAEAHLAAIAYDHWIAVDPRVRPVPGYHEFLNRTSPVVFLRLQRRGLLVEEPWDGPPGVLLYRFVRP